MPPEYADFGFSLEIPDIMGAWAHGWRGFGSASPTSGLLSCDFAGSPYERIGVQWSTSEAPADLASELAAFLAVLAASGNRIDAAGAPEEAAIGGREVLHQRVDVETPEGPLSAVVGAFACGDTGRAFVIYRAIQAELAGWLDPFDGFERLVASFACHE